MLPERLNVDCDKQATTLPVPGPDPSYMQNPMIECAYPHLQIGMHVVTCQLQHQLHDAATLTSYQPYHQQKFQWMTEAIQCIHWKVSQLVLQQVSHMDKRIISKFIHKWLPLLDRYHVSSNSINKQCPSCHGATKTVSHFINCPHPEQQQI